MKRLASIVLGSTIATAAATTSWAQAPAQTIPADRAHADEQRRDRAAAELRYQIGQMERVLEGAVEHGVTVTRDRMQAVTQMPADMLVSDNAHARGFRLEGYGVFFDVIVPSFETTMTWTLRTLDQNDLGLDSALRALESHVKTAGDPNLEQALKRIELQMNPAVVTRSTVPDASDARRLTGSAASVEPLQKTDLSPAPDDPILSDPNGAYRAEVISALKDAMLSHSRSFGIGPNEWLTVAAKGNQDRPRLAPADSDARTSVIRLSGSDLADFLAGRISRDEALQRIEVRVF